VSDNLTGQDAQDAQNAQDAVCDRCGGPAGGEGKTIMVVTRKAVQTLAICGGRREHTERMEENGQALELIRELGRMALDRPERAEPHRTPAQRLGEMLGVRIPDNPAHAGGMCTSVIPIGKPAWPWRTADRQPEGDGPMTEWEMDGRQKDGQKTDGGGRLGSPQGPRRRAG
jgi:hypothetical protein